MNYRSLNQDSMWRIKNIEQGFRNYPAFADYAIKSYVYDLWNGAHALEITRDGRFVNLWLFFPDITGKIESIACYGANLQGHYNAMRSSMMAFGMPIREISIESGHEAFLDIYLDY